MKLDINYIVTLENGKEYIVESKIKYNNRIYYLLIDKTYIESNNDLYNITEIDFARDINYFKIYYEDNNELVSNLSYLLLEELFPLFIEDLNNRLSNK